MSQHGIFEQGNEVGDQGGRGYIIASPFKNRRCKPLVNAQNEHDVSQRVKAEIDKRCRGINTQLNQAILSSDCINLGYDSFVDHIDTVNAAAP